MHSQTSLHNVYLLALVKKGITLCGDVIFYHHMHTYCDIYLEMWVYRMTLCVLFVIQIYMTLCGEVVVNYCTKLTYKMSN